MKKNGFTLVELLAVVVILGIMSGIAVVSYSSYINSTKQQYYKDAEKSMSSAAESLITYCQTGTLSENACESIPSIGESVEINLEKLTKYGFINEIVDQDKSGTCTGNVKVSNNGFSTNYDLDFKVCLICSDFKSEGC